MTGQSFKKAEWINNTNVYEVNLRQYTTEGTFNAFAKELPRLKEMGVSTLWFMPITPISKKNMKGTMGSYYACSDYVAVNPEFGSLEDFDKLVKLAHVLGFKVIIDWVANHTGWDNVWTKTHPEYYKWNPVTNDFHAASGMDDIIELDFENPALRAAMIEAMLFWVKEYDIDGFRCDLAFWVKLDFWMEARTALEKEKTLFWLAESEPIENPDYFKAFDACYTWTWMHKTEAFYKENHNLDILKQVLSQYDRVCGKEDILLWFTTNHDENSWNGSEYEKYGEMALALAVFSFTRNGIPLIYSGQELPNKKRLMFFDKDPIDWNGKYEMHDFYKTLLTLHTDHPALRAGDPAAITINLNNNIGNNGIAFLRKNGDREVLVILNFSNDPLDVELDPTRVSGKFTEIFSKEERDFSTTSSFQLQAWSYLVYEK